MPIIVTIKCRHCGGEEMIKYSFTPNGKQKCLCQNVGDKARRISPRKNPRRRGRWKSFKPIRNGVPFEGFTEHSGYTGAR
jgi:hypothetical protein